MGEQYHNITTTSFLKSLGQGSGMPGSGCAAAYTALMGISILQSVCRITIQKKDYHESHDLLKKILLSLSEHYQTVLEKLMQQDADAVQAMLNNTFVKELTTTPIAICSNCIDVLKIALDVFDHTYAPMLGDSAAAIAMIESTVKATLFISKANTKNNSSHTKEIEAMKATYFHIRPELNKRLAI